MDQVVADSDLPAALDIDGALRVLAQGRVRTLFERSAKQLGEAFSLALASQARKHEYEMSTLRAELSGELAAMHARLQDQIDSQRDKLANLEFNLMGIEQDNKLREAREAAEAAAREKRAQEAADKARRKSLTQSHQAFDISFELPDDSDDGAVEAAEAAAAAAAYLRDGCVLFAREGDMPNALKKDQHPKYCLGTYVDVEAAEKDATEGSRIFSKDPCSFVLVTGDLPQCEPCRTTLAAYDATSGKRVEVWGLALLHFREDAAALAFLADFDGRPASALYGGEGSGTLDVQRLTDDDGANLARSIRSLRSARYGLEPGFSKQAVLVSGLRYDASRRRRFGAFCDQMQRDDDEARHLLSELGEHGLARYFGPPIAGLAVIECETDDAVDKASRLTSIDGVKVRSEKIYHAPAPGVRRRALIRKFTSILNKAACFARMSMMGSLTQSRIQNKGLALNVRVEQLEEGLRELAERQPAVVEEKAPVDLKEDDVFRDWLADFVAQRIPPEKETCTLDSVLAHFVTLGVLRDNHELPDDALTQLQKAGIVERRDDEWAVKTQEVDVEGLRRDILEVVQKEASEARDSNEATRKAVVDLEERIPMLIEEQKKREAELYEFVSTHLGKVGNLEERLGRLAIVTTKKVSEAQVLAMMRHLEATIRGRYGDPQELPLLVEQLRVDVAKRTTQQDVSRHVEAQVRLTEERLLRAAKDRTYAGWAQSVRPVSAKLAPLQHEARLIAQHNKSDDDFVHKAAQWAASAATAAVLEALDMEPTPAPEIPIPAGPVAKQLFGPPSHQLVLASYPNGRPGALRSLQDSSRS